MNHCKKFNAKPYSFLVNDTTLVSDNPLPFTCNLSERMEKVTMTSDEKIRDGKLQSNVNKEIVKNEYVTDEEMLTSDQSIIIDEAKCTYPSLGKAFKKQAKTIKKQGQKQIDAIMNKKEIQLNLIMMMAIHFKNKKKCLINLFGTDLIKY